MLRTVIALSMVAAPAVAYWDGSRSTADPYTEAMMMSRKAQLDPNAMRNDPDIFRRMFGKLAVEQSQARAMDETQSAASTKDMCMVCHGTVVEFEKMWQERKGTGKRDMTMVTEILEGICHLNRYEFQDPVKITNRIEHSRNYGGMAPPVFANACKRVVDAWGDRDGVEEALITGGPEDRLHEQLRNQICHGAEGFCHGFEGSIASEAGGRLAWKGGEEGQCGADGGEKKKKKKKKKRAEAEAKITDWKDA